MAGLLITDPVNIATAFSSPNIVPGDEIVLLPGTYTASAIGEESGSNEPGKGVFRVKLHGAQVAPIVIRPHIPGTVRINGGLEITDANSSNIIVKDLEIAPTPTTREIPRADVDFPSAIYCTAPGCKFYGNYLHDGFEGMEIFNTGGCDIQENIAINHGWKSGDGVHGAGIYTHNNSGGALAIKHNIWGSMGEHAINMWSASTNAVKDYACTKNAVLDRRLFCASESGVCADNVIEDNHIFRGVLRLGMQSALNGLIEVRRNRAHYGLWMWWQRRAVVENNYFYNFEAAGYPILYQKATDDEQNTVDNNNYLGTHADRGVYSYYHERQLAWAEWQALGYDVNSTILAETPSTNEIFVYPYEHSARWLGMVVVWNWTGAASVTVDLTTIESLSASDGIYLCNGQDPINDKLALELDANKCVSVDMRAISHTVVAPVGWTAPATTFPTFGCFVVERA